ncbi:MAG: hypothetical protein K1060chlam4_00211 [Candidatus Anoxychlamydiales bacterium]|nr:hypothetical protein [Candidatus Anoxychlamydiales bacterium]
MSFINLMVIGALFFCSSCSKTEYEKKRDLENKIIGQTWRQLEKEKNLVPAGEGGSIVEGDEFIGLYFQYFNPVTIDEARELVIYAAETLLHNLNSNEKLNELIDQPYPLNWIKIEIFIYNPDYSKIKPPGVAVVSFEKNKIIYFYRREKFEIGKRSFQIIQEETYEEALEKLKK